MLASHYAPLTPLSLKALDEPWPQAQLSDVAVLSFRGDGVPSSCRACEILSPFGDLAEAAMHLFAALRRLDASGARRMVAETVPEHGLGLGINDRLRRAAGLG